MIGDRMTEQMALWTNAVSSRNVTKRSRAGGAAGLFIQVHCSPDNGQCLMLQANFQPYGEGHSSPEDLYIQRACYIADKHS